MTANFQIRRCETCANVVNEFGRCALCESVSNHAAPVTTKKYNKILDRSYPDWVYVVLLWIIAAFYLAVCRFCQQYAQNKN